MDREEYLAAVAQAAKWAEEYYDNDEASVTDYEYDMHMQIIKKVEAEHPDWVVAMSPTQHVGGSQGKSTFAKVQHEVAMLSIQDVFTPEEVTAFTDQYPNEQYSVEKKIDGLSMSATYEHVDNTDYAELALAETRGDGYIGEDITENAKYIEGLPLRVKTMLPKLIVRGEVYMPVSEFERVNGEHAAKGEKLFANPRNAAAGILRTHDLSAVKNAHLRIFVFNLQLGSLGDSHIGTLDALAEMGFNTVEHYRASAGEVLSFIDKIGEERDDLPYWTDGAVIKLDSISLREKLGNTIKFPRWCIAFKYPPEERDVVVTSIALQTGRTGVITPVAEFEPVQLCGTSVSRATLHNQGFLDDMSIDIGATIRVIKSGEIIPKVVSCPKPAPKPFKIEFCPVCGAKAVAFSDENGQDLSKMGCPNEACPAQFSRYVAFFCSRDVMDIEGVGPAVIDALIDAGWLKEVQDLYALGEHVEGMKKLEGFGAKKVKSLLDGIEKSKGNDIDRVIKAFGILGVGRAIGKTLATRYPDMETISNLSVDEMVSIDGIGEITANDIYTFFHSDDGKARYRAFADAGINMKSLSFGTKPAEGKLSGLTFVITGTLPSMGREEAKSLIEANGGKCSGSVSKKTNYLLAGEAAGSKLSKANDLGIPVISEAQLMEMLK